MDMFKMIKEAAAMRSKLNEMDKMLKQKIVETESNGIKIKMNGKTEVLEVKVAPEVLKQDHAKIEKDLFWAFSTAIKKSQEVMTEEAKKLTGGMNIPGLM